MLHCFPTKRSNDCPEAGYLVSEEGRKEGRKIPLQPILEAAHCQVRPWPLLIFQLHNSTILPSNSAYSTFYQPPGLSHGGHCFVLIRSVFSLQSGKEG